MGEMNGKEELQHSIPLVSANHGKLYFITNQRNLMSFLGAGMIVPAPFQFRYREDSREEFLGAIPFWKGGLPSAEKYQNLLADQRVVLEEEECPKLYSLLLLLLHV